MLNIAIVDDEKYFRNEVKSIVERYMSKTGLMYKIDTFHSGKEFIDQGIDMVKYDILFLDINMDGVDGIQTAKKVRDIVAQLSRQKSLIFIMN